MPTRTKPATPAIVTTRDFIEVPLNQLYPDPENLRTEMNEAGLDELEQSIFENGLHTPLDVRQSTEDEAIYFVVAGHRRLEALTRLAKKKKVAVDQPVACTLKEDGSRPQVAAAMLIENLQREGLNPIDEARGYIELVTQHGWKNADLARKMGKSPAHITKRLSLLKLPAEAQAAVASGKFPIEIAYDLTRIEDDKKRARLAKEGAAGKLQSYEVDNALRAEATAKKAAALAKWLEAHTITPVEKLPEDVRDTHRFIESFDATSIKEYTPAKTDIVHRWSAKDTTVNVWRRLTKKEREERAAKPNAPLAHQSDESKLDPRQLWERNCWRIRDAHNQAKRDYARRAGEVRVEVIRSLTGKALTKVILEMVVSTVQREIADGWCDGIARVLDLPFGGDDGTSNAALAKFIGTSGDRYLQAFLVGSIDGQLSELDDESESLDAAVASALAEQGIVAPNDDDLDFGIEPWLDGDVWVIDREAPGPVNEDTGEVIGEEEQAAIDAIRSEADEDFAEDEEPAA